MSRLRDGDRVALRLPNWLGDFVMAEPLVNALHERERAGRGPTTLIGPARPLALFDGRFESLSRVPLGAGRDERVADWRGHDAAVFLNASFESAARAWLAVARGAAGRPH